MKIKSYYARTVEDALVKASEEMGADAILVHSRRTPLELRHLGPYEVVFALPEVKADGGGKQPGTYTPRSAARTGSASPARNGNDQHPRGSANAQEGGGGRELPVSVELMQMRRQIEEIRRAVTARPIRSIAVPEAHSPTGLAQARLVAAGVDGEIATEIVETAAPSLRALSAKTEGNEEAFERSVTAVLRKEMLARVPSPPEGKQRQRGASAVALVGPPGVGKTTMIAKLAVTRSQTASRPVHLISTDMHRIGAAEQLRTFASILGVGIDFADTPAALGQAVEANRNKELILIDTPGLSGLEFELLDEMADFIARRRDIETQLVLPATMRSGDLKRVVRNYERFRPGKLVFTRLDETDCFGGVYSAVVWSGSPVSFLSAGQQIPEDLSEGNPDMLVELVLGGRQTHA